MSAVIIEIDEDADSDFDEDVVNDVDLDVMNAVIIDGLFVYLFCCFTSQVNSYGHCGTVSSPNHTFSWAGLNKQLTSNSCTYFCL